MQLTFGNQLWVIHMKLKNASIWRIFGGKNVYNWVKDPSQNQNEKEKAGRSPDHF